MNVFRLEKEAKKDYDEGSRHVPTTTINLMFRWVVVASNISLDLLRVGLQTSSSRLCVSTTHVEASVHRQKSRGCMAPVMAFTGHSIRQTSVVAWLTLGTWHTVVAGDNYFPKTGID